MYDGPAEFVARTLPIVQRARTDGAAVLVVVPEPRLTALRTAVGDATTDVTFTDMTMVGRNPGRIISVWDDFVRGQAGGRVVGIGEPIWSGRSRTSSSNAKSTRSCSTPRSLRARASKSSAPTTWDR